METDEVLRRLDRLERENRFLKRGGVSAFVVIAALFLASLITTHPVAAQSTGPLVASGFYVVDKQGQIRAALAMDNPGTQPMMVLYNPPKPRENAQKARAMITLDDSGDPTILLSPPPGAKGTVTLHAGAFGGQFSIGGVGPSSWGLLASSMPDGSGVLTLLDGSGNIVWSAP